MKKFIIALSLIACTLISANAQEGTKPEAGAKQFSFGITGFNPFNLAGASQTGNLLFRYYLADGLAARVGLGFDRTSASTEETSGGIQSTSKESTSLFLVSLGAQKSLGDLDKVEPYIGADIILGFGSVSSNDRAEVINSNVAGGQNGDFSELDISQGTSLIGLLPAVGFNYYFTQGLSLGAEFSWGLVRQSIAAGTVTFTDRTSGVTTVTSATTGTASMTEIGSFGQGRIVFSVTF